MFFGLVLPHDAPLPLQAKPVQRMSTQQVHTTQEKGQPTSTHIDLCMGCKELGEGGIDRTLPYMERCMFSWPHRSARNAITIKSYRLILALQHTVSCFVLVHIIRVPVSCIMPGAPNMCPFIFRFIFIFMYQRHVSSVYTLCCSGTATTAVLELFTSLLPFHRSVLCTQITAVVFVHHACHSKAGLTGLYGKSQQRQLQQLWSELSAASCS